MNKILCAIISLYLIVNLFPQNNSVEIEYDYARFANDDTSGYLELYYSFYVNDFRPTFVENKEVVNGSLFISINDSKTQNLIVNKEYQFKSELKKDSNFNNNLIGNLSFQLPYGNYSCKLIGKDLALPQSGDTVDFVLEMIKPLPDRVNISDIQLSSSIQQSNNTNSVFYKNSYEVVPNPAMIFGQNLPIVYFYSELYNVNKNIQSEVLTVYHQLYNSKNNLMYDKKKYVMRKNNNIVDAGAINIHKMPTGAYTLNVSVTDSISKYKVISSKKLYVYNPNVVDTATVTVQEGEILASEFISMSDEELNESFEIAKYIATGKEVEQWGKLSDADGKRKFLFTFWKDRTQVPGVEQYANTSKQYYEKAKYSNEKFGNIHRKGWKTDRGRVYIMYGEPSEIDRYPNQVDVKPYEIWYYNNIEGGVIFVFADLTGFSDYMLIHSTMRGELRDDTWQRRIKTN